MALQHFHLLTHIQPAEPSYFLFPKKLFRPLSTVATRIPILCIPTGDGQTSDGDIIRRSGNYTSNKWNHDLLSRLNNVYEDYEFTRRAKMLEKEVRNLLKEATKWKALRILELVDNIERLGLGHLFEDDIKITLGLLKSVKVEDDLHTVSLHFRILRQHGFEVSQDVFRVFKDRQGNFSDTSNKALKGILSLYEASFLSKVGEDDLLEAQLFATQYLKDVAKNQSADQALGINHELEVPLHYRLIRLEARWYIETYSKRTDANFDLLQLTILDYNIVQAAHQKDIINLSRWWRNLGLTKVLPFTREKLVECFFGSMGTTYGPQYSGYREGLTKLLCFINSIDDIYDVYATLDEAEHFTGVVERWDVNSLNEIPDYMKMCFLSLHNATSEIAYHILKDKGLNVIPYLKRMWVDTCKAYLVEAKWFRAGYKPTLGEYLENAWVSVTGPLLLVHIYVLMCPVITIEALEYLSSYPDLVRSMSMILWLTNDMATYKSESARGDVFKSIQCYMNDKGVSEKVAHKYIRNLADEEWKKMNTILWAESPLPHSLIKEIVNLARSAESVYEHGDPCTQDQLKEKIIRLLVESIPMLD